MSHHRIVRAGLLVLVLVCSGGALGAADDAKTVSVTITSNGFEPRALNIAAKPGQNVRVEVTNKDQAPHGLRIKFGNTDVGLDQPVAGGSSATFEFTMPERGGMGSFFSPGDESRPGFRGRAIVGGEAPGG